MMSAMTSWLWPPTVHMLRGKNLNKLICMENIHLIHNRWISATAPLTLHHSHMKFIDFIEYVPCPVLSPNISCCWCLMVPLFFLGYALRALCSSKPPKLLLVMFLASQYFLKWRPTDFYPITIWFWLTVCHGKSPFLIGKPSINGPFPMAAAMLNNQRVFVSFAWE